MTGKHRLFCVLQDFRDIESKVIIKHVYVPLSTVFPGVDCAVMWWNSPAVLLERKHPAVTVFS